MDEKKVHNLRTRIYNMNEKFDNMEGKYSKKSVEVLKIKTNRNTGNYLLNQI